MPLTILLYFALCLMVAYLGRRTRVGFFRCFLFSMVLTPLFMVVYLLMFMSIDAEAKPDNSGDGHNGR